MKMSYLKSVLIIVSAASCMECFIFPEPHFFQHVNAIHKDKENKTKTTVAEFPVDDNSKIVALIPSNINESEPTTHIKPSKIPLVHQHDKKVIVIKHPLPPSWHDIMPHEPLRPTTVDHEKFHKDFLHHEGPALQRRLHHLLTVEELRQKHKEMREKMQNRHNKLTHVTPHTLHEQSGGILKMAASTTEKMRVTEAGHHIIEKTLETTSTETTPKSAASPTLSPGPVVEYTKFDESNLKELNAFVNSHYYSPETQHDDNMKISNLLREDEVHITPPPSTSLKPESTTEMKIVLTSPNLLDLLSSDHRNILHDKHRSFLRKHTSVRNQDIPNTKDKISDGSEKSPTIHLKENQVESTEVALQVPVLKKPVLEPSIDKAVETADFSTEEPQMFQDWRDHLREAIKKRLHSKLHQHSEDE